MSYLFTTMLIICFYSCQQKVQGVNDQVEDGYKEGDSDVIEDDFYFDYNLDEAFHTSKLPRELREISGLSFDEESSALVAVNDEQPYLYFLNQVDGQIIDRFKFGKPGDYEGVEIVGDVAYILKSNGTLHSFNLKSLSSLEPIKTPLTLNNDVEGLGYDLLTGKLLLACKGSPTYKGHEVDKKSKAIYTWDIKTEVLVPSLSFVLSDLQLLSFIKEDIVMDHKKRAKSFAPSAIAVHPTDGNYYMLSSVGKLLVVCNPQGAVLAVKFLNKKVFKQPEGICFAPQGTMFISNEGRSESATILSFTFKNK